MSGELCMLSSSRFFFLHLPQEALGLLCRRSAESWAPPVNWKTHLPLHLERVRSALASPSDAPRGCIISGKATTGIPPTQSADGQRRATQAGVGRAALARGAQTGSRQVLVSHLVN